VSAQYDCKRLNEMQNEINPSGEWTIMADSIQAGILSVMIE
jgi:hypothetical protein